MLVNTKEIKIDYQNLTLGNYCYNYFYKKIMSTSKQSAAKAQPKKAVEKFVKKNVESILITANPKMEKKVFKKGVKKASKY